jgi:hypothetical protein
LTDGTGPSSNIPWQKLGPLHQFCILEELNEQVWVSLLQVVNHDGGGLLIVVADDHFAAILAPG